MVTYNNNNEWLIPNTEETIKQYKEEVEETFYLDCFNKETRKTMKEKNYLGWIIYTIILNNGKIINHQFFCNGVTEEGKIGGIPYKIPLPNFYTVKDNEVNIESYHFIPLTEEELNLDLDVDIIIEE